MANKDILSQIIARKEDEVAQLKKVKFNLAKRPGTKPLDFKKAITKQDVAIIAEIKKASPSAGVLTKNFNVLKIAENYQKSGAQALSILTDYHYFQGCNDYLTKVHLKFKLPILRKDFIIDPYQVEESYFIGADAILLIVAALSATQLKNLQDLAADLGLAALVEVHNRMELETALACDARLIGVNNRNLSDFKVDLDVSLNLAQYLPDDVVKVSESGISSAQQVKTLAKAGFDAILVGTSLIKSDTSLAGLRSLVI